MEKKLKGKTICHICTLIGLILLITCSILKWVGILVNVEQGEIIAVSTAIRAFALPIDLNMSLDKRVKEKECGGNTTTATGNNVG